MIDFNEKTKYKIEYTGKFKKQLKKLVKQEKNILELKEVITKLANLEELESKYKNHNLVNNKIYNNCKKSHIKPDWLLVYTFFDDKLILLLVETGSHSELFKWIEKYE